MVHGTNSDSVANFEADVPKQEAVVNAFKVSSNNVLLEACPDNLLACVACIWYVHIIIVLIRLAEMSPARERRYGR